MPLPRTDLAIEATQLFNEQQTGEIPGVTVTEDTVQGFPVTQVEITSPEGAEAVGKPQGRYLTLDLNGLFLPGWFALDEGFYGLLLPTMMNIAEALD